MIDMFIEYGLVIKREIVYMCVAKHISMPNIERFFGPEFYDEDLYFHCHKNNFWPTDYKEKWTIPEKIIKFREMFISSKWSDIEKYMEENDVYIDGYCLENSVYNLPLLNILKDNCNPTLGLILRLYDANISQKYITEYLLNKFKENNYKFEDLTGKVYVSQ